MTKILKALIVEDEPIARDLLQSMLAGLAGVEVVGVAGNVTEAVSVIAEQQPDVVFLDIEIGDGTGFDVIEALDPESVPAIVFVTAYDEYAVRAFEVMALDYLMKPFDEARLDKCLERVHARFRDGGGVAVRQLLHLLEDLRGQRRPDYADRLPVDAGTHAEVIPAEAIDWVEAKGKGVLVHTRSATFSMREGLSSVAARLHPRDFLRVHRSAVIRVDRVKEIHRWSRGDYRLVLRDGTKLVTGTRYREGIEARLLGKRKPPMG
jgi:two-component system, LytTR family, response regulator